MNSSFIELEKVCFSLIEILRLFFNTLTADDKYSHSNMQNLPEELQTPLSQQQKTFSGIFIAFPKCTWNL